MIGGKIHDGEEVVVDYDRATSELVFQPMPVLV
jgi:hypothetical protein